MTIAVKQSISALIIGSVLASVAFAGVAFAKSENSGRGNKNGRTIPGIVTSAPTAGGTFTITIRDYGRDDDDDNFVRGMATTTLTVATASSTTITKNGAAVSVAALSVGDKVLVRGRLNGSTLTATSIRAVPGHMNGLKKVDASGRDDDDVRPRALRDLGISGTGQPVIGGTVTAVSSSTLTIANKGGATFTVDATSARIVKNNATSTLSNIAVGDKVVVQGMVNGASITASTILDAKPNKGRGNFFGHIGKFFSRMFGFF